MRTLCYVCTLVMALQACSPAEKHETMQEKTIQKVAESTKKKSIDDFFAAYELNFNKGLSQGGASVRENISASFASCFVESSPAGVICGANDDTFRKKIEEGFTVYKNIGSTSMKITSKEITDLDELHAMVKVGWRYKALKDGKEITIDFENTYFLVEMNGELKVFAYIAGDEQKALKDKGLI